MICGMDCCKATIVLQYTHLMGSWLGVDLWTCHPCLAWLGVDSWTCVVILVLHGLGWTHELALSSLLHMAWGGLMNLRSHPCFTHVQESERQQFAGNCTAGVVWTHLVSVHVSTCQDWPSHTTGFWARCPFSMSPFPPCNIMMMVSWIMWLWLCFYFFLRVVVDLYVHKKSFSTTYLLTHQNVYTHVLQDKLAC